MIECPNCGAPARHADETVCRFCETALPRPTGPGGPPPVVPAMTVVPTSPTVNRLGCVLVVLFLVVVPTVIGGIISYSAFKTATDSASFTQSSTFTNGVNQQNQQPAPTLPTINGELIAGDATAKDIDCSAGQSYTIKGNLLKVTSTGGTCGTVIVSGNAATVTLAGVRDLWVNGNGNQVRVTEVGTITSIGSVNTTTWTRGLDGATPTVYEGGSLDTVHQG